ncbi:MAG: hypothetical protein BROFUL_02299 [Candidatus Brocadia fulgida]|uniref:Uncharacterized protein n=1 Tax=Candidatus Brocadia fulgida TaxID=380242 RepID=A0A0M2UTR9_9BACT|nr:MAG: hypothetical protein BROFUL_02299 [Candidatus Brocadia fulgida]
MMVMNNQLKYFLDCPLMVFIVLDVLILQLGIIEIKVNFLRGIL